MKQAESDMGKKIISLQKKHAAAERRFEREKDKNKDLQRDLKFEKEATNREKWCYGAGS